MGIDFSQYVNIGILVLFAVVGYIIKNTKILDDSLNGYIPLINGVLGAIAGALVISPDIDGITIGAISALASTGVYEAIKNFTKGAGNSGKGDA